MCKLPGPADSFSAESQNERVGQGMSRKRGARVVAVPARRSPNLSRRAETMLRHLEACRQPSRLPRLLPLRNELLERVSPPLLVSSSSVPHQQPHECGFSGTATPLPKRTNSLGEGSQVFWAHPREAPDRMLPPSNEGFGVREKGETSERKHPLTKAVLTPALNGTCLVATSSSRPTATVGLAMFAMAQGTGPRLPRVPTAIGQLQQSAFFWLL